MQTVPRAGIFRHRDNEDPGSDQLRLESKFQALTAGLQGVPRKPTGYIRAPVWLWFLFGQSLAALPYFCELPRPFYRMGVKFA